MKTRRTQAGLSMIELMIGILLASLIIAGVLYIFNGSRASSLLIEAESKMLDEAQFAMENMNSVIRMAGYTMDPFAGIDSIVTNAGSPTVTADVVQGTEGGSDAPDTIKVWYEGNDDGSVFDCHGETVDEDGTTGNGILRSNEYFISATGSLSCVRDTGNAQPLINDVADLQILYGIDTDSTADGSVNMYKHAGELSVDERLRIVTVMLSLTLEATIVGDTMKKTFTSEIYLRNRSS